MTHDHTTHFDDCGCLSAKMRERAERAERAAQMAENERAEARNDAAYWRAKTEQAERERDEALEYRIAETRRADLAERAVATNAEDCINLRACAAAAQARERGLREALEECGEHGRDCTLSRWEAGRPTASGGYEACYAGKWYETRPVDRTPPCECGLSAALAAPQDDSALREIVAKAVRATEVDMCGWTSLGLLTQASRESIVARVLGDGR